MKWAALLSLVVAVSSSDDQPVVLGGVKLNAPLTQVATTGDVDEMLLSPDGQWVVYLADQDTAGRPELYSARRDGTGSPVRLNGGLVAGGNIANFLFTPDGARVLYQADQDINNVHEIYSVLVDGSAPAVKLNPPLSDDRDVNWADPPWPVTSDGQTVVYLADQTTNGVHQLYAVPTDGSAAAITLFPVGPTADVASAVLASDDATVVFRGDLLVNEQYEIFKVPIDGSAAPVLLNGPIGAGTDVYAYEVAPDASRLVYGAFGPNGSAPLQLFSVPIDQSSGPVVLSGTPPPGGNVTDFKITGDSQRVVYRAHRFSNGPRDVYSAPIDGSGPVVQLNAPTSSSPTFSLSPDGSWVVFQSAGIYTVPVDGAASPSRLDTWGGATIQAWQITPDSSRVVVAQSGLYSVPIDGLGTPTLLGSDPAPGIRIRDFVIATDLSEVVYTASRDSFSHSELHSVPLDGASAPVHLNPGAPWTQVQPDYAVDAASSTLVYRGDTAQVGVNEVFAVPLDASAAPAPLSGALPTQQVVLGEVLDFALSPDGRWAVYADARGYHSAPVGRPGEAVLLSPPAFSRANAPWVTFQGEIGFTPDSGQALFNITTTNEMFLYRAPVDGSAPAALIHEVGANSESYFHDYRFTPDAQTLLFRGHFFVYETPNGDSVYSVPLDGSAEPILVKSGPFSGLVFSGDGASVVYSLYNPFSLDRNLHSVPVDGSGPPVSLLPPGRAHFGSLALAADGQTVVFGVQDEMTSANRAVYRSPADASSPPELLTSVYANTVVTNPVTPHVAYVTQSGSVFELYYGPVDGGQPPTLLATLPTPSYEVIFSPDGTRIVYRADWDVAEQYELYSVPVDGSLPLAKVSGPMTSGGDVTAVPAGVFPKVPHFGVTSDSATVVYLADARVDEIFEMWSAPIDGGGPVVILNNPLPPGLNVYEDFKLLSDPKRILFRGNPSATLLPVWEARVGQTGPFRLRSGPFPHATTVESGFQVTSDEAFVVYRSDQGTEGVTELYSYSLRHLPRNKSFFADQPLTPRGR